MSLFMGDLLEGIKGKEGRRFDFPIRGKEGRGVAQKHVYKRPPPSLPPLFRLIAYRTGVIRGKLPPSFSTPINLNGECYE